MTAEDSRTSPSPTGKVPRTEFFSIEERTKDPGRALDLLLSEALPLVPEIAQEKMLAKYEELRRAWASKVLLEGEDEVRRKALLYLEALSKLPNFDHFDISGNPHQAHAQVNAVYVGTQGRPESVSPFRAWRADNRIFGCGNSMLIA
jgi:hypothetical protein